MALAIGNLPASADLAQLRLSPQERELAKLRADATPRDRDQIKQSAEEFESLFLNIVLKSMRDTVQKSGLLDGGNAEEIYRGMLDDEYTKMMAAQRHTGLADEIERFLLTAVANTKKDPGPAATTSEKTQGIKAYQAAPPAAGLQPGEKQARMEDGPPSDFSPSHRAR